MTGPLPRSQRLIKRSLSIGGHRTSIALEEAFWAALEQLAQRRGQTMPQLVAGVDAERTNPHLTVGLASSLRILALKAALSGEIDAATLSDTDKTT